MTNLADLGVTPNKLRAYGHDGQYEALTITQLKGICCHLKAQMGQKEGKFKRWSKSTAKEMRGIGVTQDQRSGEPTITYRKAKVVENISVSLEDFNRVEDELKAAKAEIEAFKDEGTPTGEFVSVKGIGDVEVISTKPMGNDYWYVMDPPNKPGGIKPEEIHGEFNEKPDATKDRVNLKPGVFMPLIAEHKFVPLDEGTSMGKTEVLKKPKSTRRTKKQMAADKAK